MVTEPTLKTLQLVTTPRPFFRQQVRVLEENGVSCEVLPVPGKKGERTYLDYLRFQGQVLRKTLNTDYDLIQANYGLTGPAAVAQPKRPVVLWLWGTELKGRYSRVNKRCADLADAVIVMSEEMASRYDGQSYVIRHGINTDAFKPMSQSQARAELGWDHESRHVLFPYDPGRDLKNFPLAERVVARASTHVDSAVEIHAVHGVEHERIPVFMNASDALLLTSDTEGSPNSVREALACNLPIVSVDVGDVRERVAGVQNCYVCSDADALVARLVDVLASDMRSDGRQKIDEFSLERMVKDLFEVYDSVLPSFQRDRLTH